MIWNALLIAVLVICFISVVNYVRKRMDRANSALSRKREIFSLVINCNNYMPMGDVFADLNELLKVHQESDHIEYRGHF